MMGVDLGDGSDAAVFSEAECRELRDATDCEIDAAAELAPYLAEAFGNAVRIDYDPDRRRGELRITFHDLDEFDGLLARLGYTGDG